MRILFALLALMVVFGASPVQAHHGRFVAAESAKLGPEPDGSEQKRLGSATAIDGDTALVGAPETSVPSGTGSAYVFTRSSGDWEQQAKLTAFERAAGDQFGVDVAISGDTAIVGAPGRCCSPDSTPGAAYIFVRSETGAWTQQAKLMASDGANGDQFGGSLAISGDTAVVGAFRNDEFGNDAGAVYVFSRDGDGSWAQQTKLGPSDIGTNDSFGYTVDLAGASMIVGSPGDDDRGTESGSAYIFAQDPAGVWVQHAKLLASDGAPQQLFGSAVALDGSLAVIGAHRDDDNGGASGSVYLFERGSLGAWSEQAKLVPSDGAAGDLFGVSVDVDDATVVVGAEEDDDLGLSSGSAYVFVRDTSGTWSEQSKLLASGGSAGDRLGGSAVALSRGGSVAVDHDTVLAGAPDRDRQGGDAGVVYVFGSDGAGAWFQKAELAASDSALRDNFGQGTAVDGDTMAIGASRDDDIGLNAGSVYVYTRGSTGAWSLQAELTASDGSAGDAFGVAVALDGDRIVVGAHLADGAAVNSGAAYIFERTGTVWVQTAKLDAADGEAFDLFGVSVDVSGGTVVVGSPLTDGASTDGGAAYLYRIDSSGGWYPEARVTPSDAAPDDRFGRSVALESDRLVVGAVQGDGVVADTGASYVFERTGSAWSQAVKLVPSASDPFDDFGESVRVDGDTIAVGAPAYSSDEAGAVYIFQLSGSSWTEEARLVPSGPPGRTQFGHSIDLQGDTLVAGAPQPDESIEFNGGAYVFARDNTTWTEELMLTASDGGPFDSFGARVAFDHGTLVVVAPGHSDDTLGEQSGAGYIFTIAAADTSPPVVVGVPDRDANGFGWFNAPVVVDWQATDDSGVATDPPDTVADIEGVDVTYTSDPSCDPSGNCANGNVTLSIDVTPPLVESVDLSLNPKTVDEDTSLTVTGADTLSGVVGGEFYLDDDPGVGSGTPLTVDGQVLSSTFGTTIPVGVHTIGVRLVDAAGNWSATAESVLVVYDPDGGFVTGGGWFYSEPGSYVPDPAAEGRASFGFVSKYKKGATVPTGTTEFQFKAGDLNFHSTSYEWLVVAGNGTARFKGTGTINGVGEYRFMIWAGDGNPDTVRVKIWTEDEQTGAESVIYDNGFDQPIDGGSVIIHRG